MVSSNQILDMTSLVLIDKIGHSRIPVFRNDDRNFIVGFLYVKKLITVTPGDNILLKDSSAIHQPLYIDATNKVFDVLDLFQTGKAHIAIVSKNSKKLLKQMAANQSPSPDCAPCGILTLEDIIEYMIQEDIYGFHLKKSNLQFNSPFLSRVSFYD